MAKAKQLTELQTECVNQRALLESYERVLAEKREQLVSLRNKSLEECQAEPAVRWLHQGKMAKWGADRREANIQAVEDEIDLYEYKVGECQAFLALHEGRAE